MKRIARLNGHEIGRRPVSLMLGRNGLFCMRSRMMRMNGMHHIFHERAPITAMAVPIIRQKIASMKRAREIMRIEAREPMPKRVHALKEKPSSVAFAEIVAEGIDLGGRDTGVRRFFLG